MLANAGGAQIQVKPEYRRTLSLGAWPLDASGGVRWCRSGWGGEFPLLAQFVALMSGKNGGNLYELNLRTFNEQAG